MARTGRSPFDCRRDPDHTVSRWWRILAAAVAAAVLLAWTGDARAGGFCTSGAQCDDANPCTKDSCGKNNLCTHTQKNCDDGDACTADSCVAGTGECLNKPKTCFDGNACTIDGCSRATGESEAAPG